MKKLNNKGMSLIELIISFSLVCVAIVYFFETLFITNKIFRTTKQDTNHYVDVAYAFNIIDYYVHTNSPFKDDIKNNNLNGAKTKLNNFINGIKDSEFTAKTAYESNYSELAKATFNSVQSEDIYYYKFFINGKEYYYYFTKVPTV